MDGIDISWWRLCLGYTLLLVPLAVMLCYKVPLLGTTLVAVVRMTVQLLFVGLYIQVIFKLDTAWLTGAWLLIMILVADFSLTRGCRVRLWRFGAPLFAALLVGTLVPLVVFILLIMNRPHFMEARFMIPIAGMILGNCLRADIIGISNFYEGIRDREKAYLHSLAQGARLSEAVLPFLRRAFQAALMPTLATMATIGLVSLPGMMTGILLGGMAPLAAIKYQIAIMMAIFCGTSITVILAIWLTLKGSFTDYGVLDKQIFWS